MITAKQQQLIKDITGRYNASLVGVFGSYSRGEEKMKSDLDLLIDFKHRMNLLDLIGLEQELSEKLGVKVDLVTVKSLNNSIKSYIERDLIRIM